MKKYFFINSFLLIIALFNYGYAEENGETKVEGEVTQGWRRDNLTWTIAGPNGKPKKVSKLKYKDINVYDTRIQGKVSQDGYFVRGMAGYGVIVNGKQQDSDYLRGRNTNHNKIEFSRSHSKVTGEYTFDSQILLGKDFALSPVLSIAPTIGYGYYKMNLKVKNLKYSIPKGRKGMKGVVSTEHATWFGPQAGLQAKLALSDCFRLTGEYNFLFPLKCHKHSYWKLRKMHFTQKTHGFGHIGVVGAEYDLTSQLALKVEGELMKFETNKGKLTKRTTHPRKCNQKMREMERLAKEVRLSLIYKF